MCSLTTYFTTRGHTETLTSLLPVVSVDPFYKACMADSFKTNVDIIVNFMGLSSFHGATDDECDDL